MMDDIQEEINAVEAAWEEAKQKNEELGEGLVEGKVVTFPVADGKSAYEIVEVGEKISIVKYREDLVLDKYKANAVDHETGEILTANLRERVAHEDTLRDHFG